MCSGEEEKRQVGINSGHKRVHGNDADKALLLVPLQVRTGQFVTLLRNSSTTVHIIPFQEEEVGGVIGWALMKSRVSTVKQVEYEGKAKTWANKLCLYSYSMSNEITSRPMNAVCEAVAIWMD